MRASYLLLTISFALALVGCDKSGIHPLGRVRDTLGPCQGDTTTWLRSTPEGTEIFLIGEPTVDMAGQPAPGCFAHTLVERDSSSHLEYGSYVGTATSGTFSYAAEYDFRYQPDRGVLSRQGSIRIDHDPPLTADVAMQVDGDELLVTYDGEQRRLTNMLDVIDAVDTTTQEGADDLFRMFNLPLLVSQSRLLGFGSSGMTQYADQTAPFVGTIANLFTVRVENLIMPHTIIDYQEFEDLTGIITDGAQITDVNLSGNGTMKGILTYRMQGRTTMIRGDVNYENVTINNGVAGGGTYTISVEGGGSFVVSYELAADSDLTAILPIVP